MDFLSITDMIRKGILVSTGEICQQHQQEYYQRKTPNGLTKPFCLSCQKDQINKQEEQGVARGLKNRLDLHSYKVFQRDSILSKEMERADFTNFAVENELDQRALNFAKRMHRHYFKGGLGNTIFSGKAGVGKSHLAVSIAKQLNEDFKKINEPKSVIFIPVSRLFSKIQDSFNHRNDFTEHRAVELLTRVDFLFLDDLGVENANNEWKQQVLTDILDNRDKTIITTNATSGELAQNYTPRLLDRILKGVEKDDQRGIPSQVFKFPEDAISKRRRAF
ncbi:ATP-binding protein [Streptococcus sp. SGI.013]|uniref:ATP-binding protein n=1 Tax=unclassified Streptococcus TaxID=2608887 RepID=UPI003D0822F1